MACYHPLTAYRLGDGTGPIGFNNNAKNIHSELQLPCGQCIGCRLERSRQWAVRCVHHKQQFDSNAFVTLTLSDENLGNGSLNHRHFQLFIKRARRRYSPARTISYYMAGEYGGLTARPHYHAILFNIDFKDKKIAAGKGEDALYTSTELDELWQLGGTTTGAVTFKSAAYVARYITAKITGPNAKAHYETVDSDGVIHQRKPEYNQMSNGLGKAWIQKYKSDVYPHGYVVINGATTRPPRYYDKWHKEEDPQTHELIEYQRYLEQQTHRLDQTPARLKVREKVTEARIRNLKRRL